MESMGELGNVCLDGWRSMDHANGFHDRGSDESGVIVEPDGETETWLGDIMEQYGLE